MGGACFSRRAQVHPGATAVLPGEPAPPAKAAAAAAAAAPGGSGPSEAPQERPPAAEAAPPAKAKRSLIKAVKDGNLALVDELLRGGCGLEDVGMWQNTPLLAACAYGSCEVALRLISQRANIFARNEHGATPLHYAAVEGSIEVTQALLAAAANREGAREEEVIVNCAPARLYNRHLDAYALRVPLGSAAESGFKELSGLLLTARACVEGASVEDGRTPLWLACRRAQVATARLLLQHGADASAKDAQGLSVLEAAATGGSEELVVALLSWGVRDVNDTAGSPLREAVRAGRRAAAEALLAHGAAVGPAAGGATALHAACERGDEHLVALLVRARAEPELRDAAGLSAFELLRRRGLGERQVARLLRPEAAAEEPGAAGAAAEEPGAAGAAAGEPGAAVAAAGEPGAAGAAAGEPAAGAAAREPGAAGAAAGEPGPAGAAAGEPGAAGAA